MEIKKFLDRDGLFYMANVIKGLLAGKANKDLSNVDDSVFKAKAESAGAGGSGGGITVIQKEMVEGTGEAYSATIEGVTTLTPGLAIILTPHTDSTSTTPTLNVNGLGEIQIRRRLSNNSTVPQPGFAAGWLAAGKPVLLIFDGTYWIVTGQDRPVTADMSGTMAVNKGGTGADTAEEALENLGAMPVAGGTFTGKAYAGAGMQPAEEYMLRNVKLSLTEETPTAEGHICLFCE